MVNLLNISKLYIVRVLIYITVKIMLSCKKKEYFIDFSARPKAEVSKFLVTASDFETRYISIEAPSFNLNFRFCFTTLCTDSV